MVKPSSIGEPKLYLDANIFKAYHLDGSYAWTMGLQSYVKEGIDIAYEVSSLSKFLAKSRTGHIYQALHIFKYLVIHIRNKLSFNPLYHHHAHSKNMRKIMSDMKEVYIDAIKDLSSNTPKPQGKSVHINCFVDADDGGDKITR